MSNPAGGLVAGAACDAAVIRQPRKLPYVGREQEEEEEEDFYFESYTREARFLTRWDQHAVALRRP